MIPKDFLFLCSACDHFVEISHSLTYDEDAFKLQERLKIDALSPKGNTLKTSTVSDCCITCYATVGEGVVKRVMQLRGNVASAYADVTKG